MLVVSAFFGVGGARCSIARSIKPQATIDSHFFSSPINIFHVIDFCLQVTMYFAKVSVLLWSNQLFVSIHMLFDFPHQFSDLLLLPMHHLLPKLRGFPNSEMFLCRDNGSHMQSLCDGSLALTLCAVVAIVSFSVRLRTKAAVSSHFSPLLLPRAAYQLSL